MKKEHNNIKKGLNNLPQYEPKPEAWDKINQSLQQGKNSKIVIMRWTVGIAATLTLMLAVQFMVNRNMETANVEKKVMQVDFKKSEPGSLSQTEGNVNKSDKTESNDQQITPAYDPMLEDSSVITWNRGIPGAKFTVIPNNSSNEKLRQFSWTTPDKDTKYGLAGSDDNSKTSNEQALRLWSLGDNFAKENTSTYDMDWDFGEGTAQGSEAKTHGYAGAGKYQIVVTDVTGNETSNGQMKYKFKNNSTITKGDIIDFTVNVDNVKTEDNWEFAYEIEKPEESYEVIEYEESYEDKTAVYDVDIKYYEEADDDGVAGYFNKGYTSGEIGNTAVKSKKPVLGRLRIMGDTINFQYRGLYRSEEPINTENYFPLIENDYESPIKEPLSTFGIDVDNASYAVMRTKINNRQVVPKDAVRVEEFINYFDYSYPKPSASQPFSVNLETADCAWNTKHQLVRIGLKGKEIDYQNITNSNLVFLIDVSGSMDQENKLPLVKKSLKLLVDQMGPNDRIAIVTYAGAAGLALKSTRCNEKEFIKKKIDKLDAGGSTAGGQGIKLAYSVALDNLIKEGNNRVIMCTDGDFNVGQSSDKAMKELIIEHRNRGIFITACGFGMGNYQDSKMETIADNGNGNYFYIDTYRESEKVFERDIRATLFTIAKDVKIQVEFNPKYVKAYRLIGYENRKMPPQDFNDDTKDGGELGAGHSVTALYEIIPANSDEPIPGEFNLKYQTPKADKESNFANELLTVKLRYKKPNGSVSWLIEKSLTSGSKSFNDASQDFRFAAGTALYAQQLRQSKYIEQRDFSMAKRILTQSIGKDVHGDRQELINLINQAEKIYNVYTQED